MRHTRRKLLGLLLALVLVCSLLPVSALADGETEPETPEVYPVWVGGTQVTSANKDDILSDGGKAKFEPAGNTLTLNHPSIPDQYDSYYQIFADGINLTVKGSVTLDSLYGGVQVKNGSLTIQADLSASGPFYGIYADQNVTILGGTVSTDTGGRGIGAGSELIISGGTVNAKGQHVGLEAQTLTINGGTVKAEGVSDTGISVPTISIGNGIVSVTADGGEKAISGDALTLGDKLIIQEPADGKNDGKQITEADGVTVAKHAMIVPGESSTYTVTVSAEPAVGGTATASPTSGAEGDEISLSATPNEGYRFKEWKVVSGGVAVADDKFTMGAENVEIQAVFEPITYTVTFDPDGGSGEMAAVTVNYGEQLTLPENAFAAPEGKEFEKWDAGAPGEKIDVSGDMTVKAVWKDKSAVTFTVSFDPNGGSGEMAAVTVNEGEQLTLPACSFTAPEGKAFDKWDAGAPGEKIDVTGDMTVTAQWKTATYTVTFKSNGGSAVASQTVQHGKMATEPEEPTRKGFVFDAWYTDTSYSEVFDFSTPITSNVTLYAKWDQVVKYTVVSGGSSVYGKTSGKELVIVVKRNPKDNECFNHFTGVQIDGGTLTKDTDYTAAAGSTVITLKPEMLGKLNTGSHIITITFDDGKATTGLTVKAGSSGGGRKGDGPHTGDPGDPGLWTALLVFSGLGLGAVALTGRKSRSDAKH